MSRLQCFAMALAILVLMAGPSVAAAHSTSLEPTYPDASLCTVEARSIADLEATAAQPLPADAINMNPGAGMPGTQDELDAMSATVQEMVACSNAGDFLRFYALFSNTFLRQGVIRPSQLTETVKPVPADERVAYIGLVYPRSFEDGRIGAVMIIDDPQAPAPAEAAFYFFVKSGNRWLIDGALSEYAMVVTQH